MAEVGAVAVQVGVVRVQLVREAVLPYAARKVEGPVSVAGLLEEYLDGADREHFVAIMLDAKCGVVAVHTVSVGSLDGTTAHPREVFKAAVLANAHSVILGHNHPSGDPTPSPQDVALTRRLMEAGKILGIEVQDHVIVGAAGRWTSLKALGAL